MTHKNKTTNTRRTFQPDQPSKFISHKFFLKHAAVAGCVTLGLLTMGANDTKAGLLDPILDPVLELVMDDEFSFNKSNEVIGAHHAYADGITGAGINIAIADTGVFPSYARQLELKSKIKREQNFRDESAWTLFGYNLGQFAHGQAMATVAIGNKNGWGGQGVAYGADGYSYRISSPGSGLAPKSPQHVADMMARFKTDNISAMSGAWGWIATRHPSVHDANWMRNAMMPFANEMANLGADGSYRGTALVFAAGNDATPNPSNLMALTPYWFPELQSKFLAVTGVDVTGWQSGDDTSTLERAYFASACGAAKDWCVAAPAMGLQMVWPNKAAGAIAGTSIATAATTGAIALIMEAFPEISAEDAIAIVLETATDIGAPGVDDVFGHGLINVEAAMQPVGTPTMTVNGYTSSALGSVLETSSLLGSGFSAALAQTSVTYEDNYGRHFGLSLDNVMHDNSVEMDLSAPTLAAFGPSLIETPRRGLFLTARGGTVQQSNSGVSLGFGMRSDAAIVPPGVLPFDHIEADAKAAALSIPTNDNGRIHMGAAENAGSPALYGAYQHRLGDNIAFAAGTLFEQNRLGGNQGEGLFAFEGTTATVWTGLSGQWQLSDDAIVKAEAMAGYMSFKGGNRQVVRGVSGVLTRAGVSLIQKNTVLDGDRLLLSASLPATIVNGKANMRLPFRGETISKSFGFSNKPAAEIKAVWAARF